MSKGNYERKRRRALQKAQQAAAGILVLEEEEVAQNEAKASERTTHQNSVRKSSPRWWMRFGHYVADKSSFTDWCIAAFTLVLAGVAIYQYRVMGSQLAVMRNDERAWVEVKPLATNERVPAVEVVAGKPVFFPIKVVNTGKTPAKQVRLTLAIEIPASSNEANFDCVQKGVCLSHVEVWGMMSPGDSDEIITPRFLDTSNPSLVATDAEATAWEEERAYVAIYGVISYVDVYNTRHWTNFCYWQNNPSARRTGFSAVKCTGYNTVDNN
jgi:hypothetical protein